MLVTALPSVTNGQELDPILKSLINKGLDKSHGLNSNGFDIEQAKTDQQLAKSVFLPKITLNGSYTHLNDDITFDENTKTLLTETQKLVIKDAVRFFLWKLLRYASTQLKTKLEFDWILIRYVLLVFASFLHLPQIFELAAQIVR